jgi:hypothetical protein
MYSESVCQVARSWVKVGSFDKRLVVRFMIFTASVRNILGTTTSLTQCNASFLTQSVQLIFSILLKHHSSKLSVYFWSPLRSVLVSSTTLTHSHTHTHTHTRTHT